MIVADSFDGARKPWSRYLQVSGFQVDEAENGDVLLALVDRAVPQVIVTELELPRWPAWCLTAWLELNPRTRHVPVILTAGDAEDGRPAALPPSAGFLVRPFKLEAMLEEIRRVLRRANPSQNRQE